MLNYSINNALPDYTASQIDFTKYLDYYTYAILLKLYI